MRSCAPRPRQDGEAVVGLRAHAHATHSQSLPAARCSFEDRRLPQRFPDDSSARDHGVAATPWSLVDHSSSSTNGGLAPAGPLRRAGAPVASKNRWTQGQHWMLDTRTPGGPLSNKGIIASDSRRPGTAPAATGTDNRALPRPAKPYFTTKVGLLGLPGEGKDTDSEGRGEWSPEPQRPPQPNSAGVGGEFKDEITFGGGGDFFTEGGLKNPRDHTAEFKEINFGGGDGFHSTEGVKNPRDTVEGDFYVPNPRDTMTRDSTAPGAFDASSPPRRAQRPSAAAIGKDSVTNPDGIMSVIERQEAANQALNDAKARKAPGKDKCMMTFHEEKITLRMRLAQFVFSDKFDGLMGFLVMLNALVMAVEFQLKGQATRDAAFYFPIIDLLFLGVFTTELVLRAAFLKKLRFLVTNPSMALDTFIVICGLVTELALPLAFGEFWSKFDPDADNSASSGATDAVQTLKALRCLRAVRVLRVLAMFEDLWTCVQIFYYALKPLFWTSVLIWLILFIFTMFAIALLGRSEFTGAEAADPEFVKNASEFYYTVDAMMTMFAIMTLDGWTDRVHALYDHRPSTIVGKYVVVYVAIMGGYVVGLLFVGWFMQAMWGCYLLCIESWTGFLYGGADYVDVRTEGREEAGRDCWWGRLDFGMLW